VGNLLRVSVPIGTAGLLMGLYNYARFGSFTDFGLSYVLISAGHRLRDLPQSSFTSFDYLMPNLAAYLIRPPKWDALFPFVRFQPGTDASVLFGFIKNPEMYVAAYPIAGVIWMNQFLLLSIIPIAVLVTMVGILTAVVYALLPPSSPLRPVAAVESFEFGEFGESGESASSRLGAMSTSGAAAQGRSQKPANGPAPVQYHFDTWTTDNGLPQNCVNHILQTRDDFIWLTTNDGLVRYDGVQFTVPS
jgi:hypothetical protein